MKINGHFFIKNKNSLKSIFELILVKKEEKQSSIFYLTMTCKFFFFHSQKIALLDQKKYFKEQNFDQVEKHVTYLHYNNTYTFSFVL